MGGEEREKSCVRVFLSVDLAGSTAFKDTHERNLKTSKSKKKSEPSAHDIAIGTRSGPPWADVFFNFYTGFVRVFDQKLGEQTLPEELKPKLVKTIGDELLLKVEISRASDAVQIVRFFAKALPYYARQNLSDHKLLLKGTAWIAGFPINNYRVLFEGDSKHLGEDYIGPSIDTGFRIAKLSQPSKLVVSADLAVLLLTPESSLDLYYDGTESFRGVLGGRPYPVIWYRVDDDDHELHKAELELRKHRPEKDALLKYCNAYIKSCNSPWLIRPYLKDDDNFKDVPEYHKLVMETWKRVDARNDDVGTDPAANTGDDGPPTVGRPSARSRSSSKPAPSKRSR
jgi:hypothetical protein